MTDFSLLGFLNISVPNEPLTPITPKKENFKILSPMNKPEDRASSSTPKVKNTPERLLERTTSSDTASTPKGKQSPYFRTSYEQAYGSKADAAPAEEAPSTPTSVSSISSTISTCDDVECDDCLNRKEQEAKKALAVHEREMEKTAFENERQRLAEEAASERRKDAEKRDKEKKEMGEDLERVRAERAVQRAQKQKEDEEDAAMRKELSKIDHSAIDAQNARNREYRGDLQAQIEDDRVRRQAEDELNKAQPASNIVFGTDEEARQAARQAAQKDILQTLGQQIVDRKAAGKAEYEAEIQEYKRRQAEEDAAYQAKMAEKEEKERRSKADILNSNKDAVDEKKARAEDQVAQERAWTLAEQEQRRQADAEERRKADEKKRAELEALHRQLADQVQRRRDALRQARDEDLSYKPKEGVTKKEPFLHCADCDKDLPAERFSNFVVTPNGKVYKKSKAIPLTSPLHKYLKGKQTVTPYDFGHNYS